MVTKTANHNQPSKKIIIIVSAMLAIIITLGGIIYYLLARDSKSGFEYDSSSIVGLMPGTDRDAMLAMLQENADNTAIAFSINSRPTAVNRTMNLLFENPEGNGKDVSITLYDSLTGETVYQSKAIKEGRYLSNVRLTKDYSPGEYTVTAYITAYDPVTHELIGEAAAELTLNVIKS